MRPIAYAKGLGTQSWAKNAPDKLEAYYGSEQEYRDIRSWEQLRPMSLEKNLDKARQSGEVVTLSHGYDVSKSIYSLDAEEIAEAAAFRGGKFLGPAESVGLKGVLFEWECEHGHRFSASLEYVLLGGGWCPECGARNVRKTVSGRNRFTSQVLSAQCPE